MITQTITILPLLEDASTKRAGFDNNSMLTATFSFDIAYGDDVKLKGLAYSLPLWCYEHDKIIIRHWSELKMLDDLMFVRTNNYKTKEERAWFIVNYLIDNQRY